MSSVGFIVEPIPEFSFGMDWWSVNRTGTIQVLGVESLMRNYALFPERFIRNGAGTITFIDNTLLNAGETETSGIEVSVKTGFTAAGIRFSGNLEGTYLLKKRGRVVSSAPWGASEVGQFTFAGDLGLRWKHNVVFGASLGDWRTSVTQLYRHGYNDQVLPGVATGTVTPPNWKPQVDAYTTYNWSLTYNGIKNLSVTGTVKNLFDKDPPFAISYSSDFGSGSSWEPRVADPRGRAFVLNLQYKFF